MDNLNHLLPKQLHFNCNNTSKSTETIASNNTFKANRLTEKNRHSTNITCYTHVDS